MASEQSQIMGFFIEESRDHLGTIERGLLNLGSTLDDREMLDEVFRAAHSVKGGAAMLGLRGIQTVSHRLEDCFKILKDNPIAADHRLESLFLQIFDSLQELVDRLQSPEGLDEQDSERVIADVEPVCEELSTYINCLSRGEVPPEPSTPLKATSLPVTSPLSTQSEEDSALQLIMTSDVLARLREMLQLFKQPDGPETRQSLRQLCKLLAQVGEQFELESWTDLVKTAQQAITDTNNTFASLAAVIIKDLKQGQELVLANRDGDIAPSAALLDLVPASTQAGPATQDINQPPEVRSPQPQSSPSTGGHPKPGKASPHGPQVGGSELSSLADLFEGDNDDLDEWEEVTHFDPSGMSDPHHAEQVSEDDSEFSDFFLDDNSSDSEPADEADEAFLDDDLFDDDLDDDTSATEPEPQLAEAGLDVFGDQLNDEQKEQELQDLLDLGTDEMLNEPSPAPAAEADSDLLDLLEFEEGEPDETSSLGKSLSLGDESTAELEALFGNADRPSWNSTDSESDLQFDDIFAVDESQEIPPENVEEGEDFDFKLDFDLDAEEATEPDTAPVVPDDEDLNFDDLEFEDEAGEDATSGVAQATAETAGLELDEFELDFDLDAEPEAESSGVETSDDELDFDLDAEPEAESSGGETSDDDLDFDLDAFNLEAEPEPDSSGMETSDDDLNFDLDAFNLEAESEPDSSGDETSDDDLNFDLDGFNLDADPEPEEEESEFSLEFDDEEEAVSDEAQGLDLDSFDLEPFAEDHEEVEGVEELSLDDLLGEEYDDEEISNSPFPPETQPEPHASEEDEFSFDDVFGDGFLDDETSAPEEFGEATRTQTTAASMGVAPETEISFVNDFPELQVLLSIAPQFLGEDGFDQLADYLDQMGSSASSSAGEGEMDEFKDLEDLLDLDGTSTPGATSRPPQKASETSSAPTTGRPSGGGGRAKRTTRPAFEQTMRVPIKQLDNLSNLVGELVVNRNSLEQDQERLRQFLDNLLHQVSQLTEVGQRMQDLYERTLLEMALLASRQHRKSLHAAESRARNSSDPGLVTQGQMQAQAHHPHEDGEYDALEMDRFTAFHEQAQDIIELIVRVRESASDIEFLVDENDQVTRQLRQITTQLQEGLTRSRMVPFSNAADRLPRGVRDNALKFGKQVDLQVDGRDTLIDRMILEHLTDPLTHLVNNAIAHGIETPEERQAKGKPPTGKITISTFHQGNQTIIAIADDGAGIDTERVKNKALQKGLITAQQSQGMTRLDIYDLLLLPGFSTRDKADDLAGRGVGMDVVNTKLNEIRGVVSTDSTLGKGTTFTIRLPLTLSISKALCCISDRAPIAFPMDGVGEVLDNLPVDRIVTEADGRAFVQWRDRQVPYQPLRELFTYNRTSRRSQMYGATMEDDTISVVILRSAGSYLAISVDQIVGEQEIVIKQLEGPIPKPTGITGATVMGDGRIVPIADVLELIDLSMGRVRHDSSNLLWNAEELAAQEVGFVDEEKAEPLVLIVDDSITVRELLSMTFKKSGYRVEQARDGQEAWEKLRSGLPCELVFCDMEMPRMNGMELLERMYHDEYLSDLPIAMLTSRTAEKMKRKAADLGARGYFTKPYLEEVLLDAAARMLNGEVLMSASEPVGSSE
ncbi:response regulator [Sodalinema gerasimenkoae]|uniref:hybrid sensor histidine kinase/response regulator n=1 Tax=Sodalinema gerasimenkoae TaxID=2862348 RepID=UPI00135BE306|nr:response regulator [Sodalinema gerasimenkoae]